jgi:hypothetical protein
MLQRADLREPAGVEDDQPVAELGRQREVVRDQQDRHTRALAKLAEELDDLVLRRHVEPGGRLVRDQEPRLRRERDRDHDPLREPARELVRIRAQALLGLCDVHAREQADRLRARFGLAHPPLEPQHLRDLLADADHGVQRLARILEDHRDLAAAHLVVERLLGQLP